MTSRPDWVPCWTLWAGTGTEVVVLCFTHGAASTLHDGDGDLATVRTAEFDAAAKVLGIGRTELLDYPDGRLGEVAAAELTEHVRGLAVEVRPSHLLAFDVGGVTGHPDHDRATAVATAAATALGLPTGRGSGRPSRPTPASPGTTRCCCDGWSCSAISST